VQNRAAVGYISPMAASKTLYWKSTCTSCRDARKALRDAGVAFVDIDYAKAPLDATTVAAIVAAAGSVTAVLNTRHEIAKSRGWKTSPPAAAEFAAAVAKEPNLLRRPVLLDGKRIIIGFDREAYAQLK